ncbi:hypothetical protein RND81_08G034800 [Saponaria officinalis]|uniref:Uncharacterized protein n=1 Tax=Saponaria officinalis TaxID=3572 RepID=A0AAW1J3F2_SAPOF
MDSGAFSTFEKRQVSEGLLQREEILDDVGDVFILQMYGVAPSVGEALLHSLEFLSRLFSFVLELFGHLLKFGLMGDISLNHHCHHLLHLSLELLNQLIVGVTIDLVVNHCFGI